MTFANEYIESITVICPCGNIGKAPAGEPIEFVCCGSTFGLTDPETPEVSLMHKASEEAGNG